MENKIFSQPQEKLTDYAWEELRKVSKKDSQNAKRSPRITNHPIDEIGRTRGGRENFYVKHGLSFPFFSKIKNLWRKIWK